MATLSVPFSRQSFPPAWPGAEHYSIDLVRRDQGSRVIVFCCLDAVSPERLRRRNVKSLRRWVSRLIHDGARRMRSARGVRFVQAMRISIVLVANSLPKLGLCVADRACADFFHVTKRGRVVMPEVPSDLKSRRQSRFGSRCYFLTKPKQLIKFDLIVQISCISPGADA